MKETLQAYATIIISTCICILIALASAQGGLISGSFPVLFLCVGVTFIIQWLVFIPSYYWSTERFYDLTGSLTFITVALIAFYNKNQFHIILHILKTFLSKSVDRLKGSFLISFSFCSTR